MTEITRIAVDTSKSVFTLHAVDAGGRAVFRRNLNRNQFQSFFEKQAPVEVVLEACGGSHHWGRWLTAAGHRVRLIPPQYVKPFVKRGKNDRNDAEAICVAASQPSIGSVPVKSSKAQAGAMLLSVRDLLVRQRTQLVNALRGHAAEFGLIAAKGGKGLAKLKADIACDAELPPEAKEAFDLLGDEIGRLDTRLAIVDAKLKKQHKADPLSQLLAAVPGIGMHGGLNLARRVDASQFKSGRHFAAWLGLTPREHSTGGKQRIGGISRAGDERLRALLVLGATTVIQHAKPGKPNVSPWLLELLKRRPRKLVAVALANKMARIVWAMMTQGTEYRPNAATA